MYHLSPQTRSCLSGCMQRGNSICSRSRREQGRIEEGAGKCFDRSHNIREQSCNRCGLAVFQPGPDKKSSLRLLLYKEKDAGNGGIWRRLHI